MNGEWCFGRHELTFTTAGGKTFSITIPDPREDLDKAQAEDVMNTIIQKNVFLNFPGTYNIPDDYQFVTHNTPAMG
ncbi:DUF2922 domain-containing protein [Desulfosporosinus metallidurans]|uniref:DUF2922 family protein n=1 Tax=Desulfosporosinus metallidurans TaxID=1888891 RepID=A0A1Q8QJA5_9FIRM|nr:DUF2922 domain-containing protein [Desulfosporosinus metallidurans]OLN27437.1 hypothetical protein DSOL_4514 [Desulfosporosinus metallidurans]